MAQRVEKSSGLSQHNPSNDIQKNLTTPALSLHLLNVHQSSFRVLSKYFLVQIAVCEVSMCESAMLHALLA